jgi:DNA-binding transcriptional LysR family regulator
MVYLEWYRSFLAVYRAGTVSGAAQLRSLTQPAVTQHILALEAAFGAELFRRTPKGMVPTESGKGLYRQVAQALDKLEEVSQNLRGAASAERPLIRIGTPLEFFREKALEPLAEAPFRFRVRSGLAQDLVEALGHGDLDLVIATQRVAVRGVEYSPLGVEHFQLVGAPDKVLPMTIVGTGLALEVVEGWLAAQRWISYGEELPIIRRFWQQSFRKRPDFQPVLVVPDLHTIAKAVELGYGISTLPDYLCRAALEAGRLRILWEPPQPVTNELWLACRRVDRNNGPVTQVKDLLLNQLPSIE